MKLTLILPSLRGEQQQQQQVELYILRALGFQLAIELLSDYVSVLLERNVFCVPAMVMSKYSKKRQILATVACVTCMVFFHFIICFHWYPIGQTGYMSADRWLHQWKGTAKMESLFVHELEMQYIHEWLQGRGT